MLEILQYIFSSFWIWLGFVIIVSIIMFLLKRIITVTLTIICGIRENSNN